METTGLELLTTGTRPGLFLTVVGLGLFATGFILLAEILETDSVELLTSASLECFWALKILRLST